MNTETVILNGDNVVITTTNERTITKTAYLANVQREIDQLIQFNTTGDAQKASRLARIAVLQARIQDINTATPEE